MNFKVINILMLQVAFVVGILSQNGLVDERLPLRSADTILIENRLKIFKEKNKRFAKEIGEIERVLVVPLYKLKSCCSNLKNALKKKHWSDCLQPENEGYYYVIVLTKTGNRILMFYSSNSKREFQYGLANGSGIDNLLPNSKLSNIKQGDVIFFMGQFCLKKNGRYFEYIEGKLSEVGYAPHAFRVIYLN